MGTKKQAALVLKGSLKTHWMMYINSVDLQVNPVDRIGMNNSNYMLRMLLSLNSKFIPPGFEFKHRIMQDAPSFYAPSIMHLKFVNGYERKYNIGASSMGDIQTQIKNINKHIEFERALTGQDDELEDED